MYEEGAFPWKGTYAIVKEVKKRVDGRVFALKTYYAYPTTSNTSSGSSTTKIRL